MSKVSVASASKSKPKISKNKLIKVTSSHPPIPSMVINAIKNLKERGGSSLQAIKKYISSTYKVNLEKVSPFIKKYLETSVTDGTLIRTKGTGASGSFKLAATPASKSDAKKAVKPKKAAKKPKAKVSKSTKKSKPKKKPAAKKLKKPKKITKKILKK